MSSDSPPGPSRLSMLGQTARFMREPLEMGADFVDKYGPVHRMQILGVGEFYVVASPCGIEQVLDTKRDAFRKSDGFSRTVGQSVFAVEGEQWEQQRAALEEFFYPARIRSYADEMVDLTEQRVARWTDGETRSLHREMNQLTLNNFFATVFDRPLDPDGDETLRRAASNLNLWFKPTSFALPEWVPTPARRRFTEAVETVRAEAQRLLNERRRDAERGVAGDDLLSTLVSLRADGEASLSDQEIIDQVLGLTFAGHDSTAILLTCALYQLGRHDEVRARFHDELTTVLDGSRPTLDDVSKLSVTRRVINETLRAHPSVHTIPRETTRAVEIDGFRLSAQTRVHVTVWQTHHDQRYWDDPDAWRPGRWESISPRDKGYAFVPFGAGPRACIGRRFARLEAMLVLATIGRIYDVDPQNPLEFEPMVTLQPADGVPVTVRRR